MIAGVSPPIRIEAGSTVTEISAVVVALSSSVAVARNVNVVPTKVAGATNVRVLPEPTKVTVGAPLICVMLVIELVPSESVVDAVSVISSPGSTLAVFDAPSKHVGGVFAILVAAA